MNQGVKGQIPIYALGLGLYRPYGLWSLNFDPSFDQNWDIKVYETIHFLNLQDNPINLSPFTLKLGQLENLTPVQKVNDLLLFWPLSGERNVVWISCNWLFCSLWPGLPTFRNCLEGETSSTKRKNPRVGSRPAYRAPGGVQGQTLTGVSRQRPLV